MPYSVSTDVASEFRNVSFTTTSLVTTAEVTEFIVQADALIDGMIGKRYEVPITGAESLKILKQISIWLVAYRVSKILKVKSASEEPNQGPKSVNLYDKALALLKKISKGDILLSDTDTLNAKDGIESYNVSNNIVPVFQKGVDQY